jgi:hypothetical protein
MSRAARTTVMTLGLFEQRIEGDESLMELARQRFREAGMGAEMAAATPGELERTMKFRPSPDTPVMVHLARDFNLVEEQSRRRIVDFATRFAGQVCGLVLHDHAGMAARREDYLGAALEMNEALEKIAGGPRLFVEYAAGLEPADYCRFFASIPSLERISPCIDIGHVGIHQARAFYARNHRGEDLCGLKTQTARLPQVIADVEEAVRAGSEAVLELLQRVLPLKKAVHFHLHDAHPLSTLSPFGVSDHLSFLTEIPLGFEHGGGRALAPMFGPAGLAMLVAQAVGITGPRHVSFTLEIHPTGERSQLGEAASLFGHWTDKTNAERMNHWLSVLCRNHVLLRQTLQAAWRADEEATTAGLDPGTNIR